MRRALFALLACTLAGACGGGDKKTSSTLDYDSQLRIQNDNVAFLSGRDGAFECGGGGAEVRAIISARDKASAEEVRTAALAAMDAQTPVEWIIADKSALIVFRTATGEAFIHGPARGAAVGSTLVAGFTRRDAAIALRSFSCAGEQFPETRKG
jgi:hypothetical protein